MSQKSAWVNLPVEELYNTVNTWAETAMAYVPNLIAGTLLYLLFWLIARAIRKVVQKTFDRYSGNKVLQHLFTTVVYYMVLGLGLFVVLGILNLDKTVTSLLAGVGVVGLALSFAFQDIAANFISGVILAFRRPFHVGEVVEIAGIMGTVSRTNLRVTVVKTFQGQEVYIPNKDVLQSNIQNFSVLGQYRIDLSVGVSYGDDLEKVEKLVLDTIKGMDGVIRKEDTIFTYTGFGSSSIDFNIMFWIDYPNHGGLLSMRSKAIKAIKKAFDQEDITIPFPIRTLDFGIKGGVGLSETKLSIKSNNESTNN